MKGNLYATLRLISQYLVNPISKPEAIEEVRKSLATLLDVEIRYSSVRELIELAEITARNLRSNEFTAQEISEGLIVDLNGYYYKYDQPYSIQ